MCLGFWSHYVVSSHHSPVDTRHPPRGPKPASLPFVNRSNFAFGLQACKLQPPTANPWRLPTGEWGLGSALSSLHFVLWPLQLSAFLRSLRPGLWPPVACGLRTADCGEPKTEDRGPRPDCYLRLPLAARQSAVCILGFWSWTLVGVR